MIGERNLYNKRKAEWSPLQPKSLYENFYVFLFYGFALGLAQHTRIAGWFGEKEFNNLLLEPLSIRTFVILTHFGVLLVIITTELINKRGGNLQENGFLNHIALPIYRAGLSGGVIAISLIMGVFGSLSFIALWRNNYVEVDSVRGILCALMLFLLAISPTLLSVPYALFNSYSHRFIQNVISVLLSLVMLSLLISTKIPMKWSMMVAPGAYIIIIVLVNRLFKRKKMANTIDIRTS